MLKNSILSLSFLGMFATNAIMAAPLLLNNQSIANGCTVSNVGTGSGTSNMVANFQLESYNCTSGQWLPADAIECKSCPANASCAGGTYNYNATTNQGIAISGDSVLTNGGCSVSTLNKSSGTVNAVPIFEPISYNCASGTYLPADAIECVACLSGATCAGGTYTFNETSDQGLSCAGTIYAGVCHETCSAFPAMHIANTTYPLFADRTSITNPTMNVMDDNGTVCYMFFEPDTPENHSGFKVLYNGSVYHAISPQ